MDPILLRHFVLIHEHQGMNNNVMEIADKIQRTHGGKCGLLEVPKLDPAEPNPLNFASPKLWFSEPSLNVHYKKYYPAIYGVERPLSVLPSTINSIRQFMVDFVNSALIPFMERCVANWNENVAQPRRGITGRLFSASKKYFGSKSTTPGSISPTGPASTAQYHYSTHEAILRKLGDYAFMMRDYRLALQVYQTASRSYSSDKAYNFVGGVMEMIAICQTLLGSMKDVEQHYDQAISSYTVKSGMNKYATRASLLLSSILEDSQPVIAANINVRIAIQEIDLFSAILLEHAASIFFRVNKLRKALVYQMLSGNRYAKCNLRELAVKSFLSAEAHVPPGWSSMKDHLHLALGRQYYFLGRGKDAVHQMLQLAHAGQDSSLDELIFLLNDEKVILDFKTFELAHAIPQIEPLSQFSICVKGINFLKFKKRNFLTQNAVHGYNQYLHCFIF
jgi:tetratricopeptide (TPR) repeat protein